MTELNNGINNWSKTIEKYQDKSSVASSYKERIACMQLERASRIGRK